MKSHHYNPQVYLRQFTDPASKKTLWEYDVADGSVKISSPKKSGCEDYYHSIEKADGTRDDETIEKSFAPIENSLPNLFKAIRLKQPLSPHLTKVFLKFLTLQNMRSPKTLNTFNKFLSDIYAFKYDIYKHSPSFEKVAIEMGCDPQESRQSGLNCRWPVASGKGICVWTGGIFRRGLADSRQ